jgi:hypothetical protein
MSMVENAQWNVIENLFNLVICPIPHTLKAKIYSTLAAFAASPNGAEMVSNRVSLLQGESTPH